MHAARDKTGDMGHINCEHGSTGISDSAEFRKVQYARIRTCPCYDHLGFVLHGKRHKLIVIQHLSIYGYTVGDDLKKSA